MKNIFLIYYLLFKKKENNKNYMPIQNLQIFCILSQKKKYIDFSKILKNTKIKENDFEKNNIDLENFQKILFFAEIDLKKLFLFENIYNPKKNINSVYKIITNWKKIKKFYDEILKNLDEKNKNHKNGILFSFNQIENIFEKNKGDFSKVVLFYIFKSF